MEKKTRANSSGSSVDQRGSQASSPATLSEAVWLTVPQLSRRWQLDRKTIYKFIHSRILPAWKISTHLYRVAVADVLRFEARNRLLPK